MSVQNLIIFLLVGLAAGWAASKVMKSRMGIGGYLVVGVIGAFLGGFLLGLLGLSAYGLIGTFIAAFVGAVTLIYLVRLIR